jgi:hypothetical protein
VRFHSPRFEVGCVPLVDTCLTLSFAKFRDQNRAYSHVLTPNPTTLPPDRFRVCSLEGPCCCAEGTCPSGPNAPSVPSLVGAPWYDESRPQSTEFFGWLPADIDGPAFILSDALDGAQQRELAVTLIGIASTRPGLLEGIGWLRKLLSDPCDCTACGLGMDVGFSIVCMEGSVGEFGPDDGWRTMRNARVVSVVENRGQVPRSLDGCMASFTITFRFDDGRLYGREQPVWETPVSWGREVIDRPWCDDRDQADEECLPSVPALWGVPSRARANIGWCDPWETLQPVCQTLPAAPRNADGLAVRFELVSGETSLGPVRFELHEAVRSEDGLRWLCPGTGSPDDRAFSEQVFRTQKPLRELTVQYVPGNGLYSMRDRATVACLGQRRSADNVTGDGTGSPTGTFRVSCVDRPVCLCVVADGSVSSDGVPRTGPDATVQAWISPYWT